MAKLSVIAGPNGSGKSTLTASMGFEGSKNLIDPDAIAKRLNFSHPARSAIPAAREAILRCRSLLASGEDFALETTLAGNGAISIMSDAKGSGYRTWLAYVALESVELHIERVRLRVAQGGHDILDTDIRRRYTRSLSQAPAALLLADKAVILDNSYLIPRRILTFQSGILMWQAEDLSERDRKLRDSLN